MRKTSEIIAVPAFLWLAVLFLASCGDLYTPVTGNEYTPPPGMGYVNVVLDYSAARTLMPTAPGSLGGFSHFTISFISGERKITEKFDIATNLGPVALEPGIWDVTVTAYQEFLLNGETVPKAFMAAAGEDTGVEIEAGKGVSITINLGQLPESVFDPAITGVFSYNVFTDLSLPNTAITAITGNLTLAYKNSSFSYVVPLDLFDSADGSMEVPAGEYDLFVTLTANNGTKAGRYSAVHICAGLETKTDSLFEFTDDDFVNSVMLAGKLEINKSSSAILGSTVTATITAWPDISCTGSSLASDNYQWNNSSEEWFLDIPVINTLSPVYLTIEVEYNDGGNIVTFISMAEPVVDIPLNGKDGILLEMDIYGITSNVPGGGGSIALQNDHNAALLGDTVIFAIDPDQDYYYVPESLAITSGSSAVPFSMAGNDCQFTMPAADVTITAEFKPLFFDISGSFDINIPSGVNLENIADNATISAYRDQGRFELVGDFVDSWVIGGIPWGISKIPVEVETIYLSVSVIGDDGYEYTYKHPVPVSGSALAAAIDVEMTIFGITCNLATDGNVSASRHAANPGEIIDLTVTPDGGFVLQSISATNGTPIYQVGGSYLFFMPEDDIVINAVFN